MNVICIINILLFRLNRYLKKYALFLALILCQVCSFSLISAQQENDNFIVDIQHWEYKNGFTGWGAIDFYQDDKGMIWLGMGNQIISFDGYEYKNYSLSLETNDFIENIEVDVNNKMWVHVKGLKETSSILIFDLVTKKNISIYEYLNDSKLPKEGFYKFYKHNDKFLLSYTNGSVYTFDGSLQKLIDIPIKNHPWIIPYQDKFLFFNPIQKKINFYSTQLDGTVNFIGEKSKDGKCYFIDEHNDLWMLDRKEYLNSQEDIIINRFTQKIELSLYQKINEKIPGIILYDQFLDKDGNFWLTSNKGLVRLNIKKNKFSKYLTRNEMPFGIRGMTIVDDKLYVADEGLKVVDLLTNEVDDLNSNGFRSINVFTQMKEDLWYTTGERMIKINDGKSHIYNNEIIIRNVIWSFLRLNKDKIWFGSQKGILQYDYKSDQVSEIGMQDYFIWSLFKNKEGIWVGTAKGLFKLNKEGEILNQFFSPEQLGRDLNVRHIYQDAAGIYWLSTMTGLIEWNAETDIYTQYSTEEGLSNNVIHAVYEDNKGQLWMPSNYGLMCFDKKTKAVKTFLESDGISHNEFNFISNYQHEDGRLFLGGMNGVNVFHPDSIELVKTKDISFYITDFIVTNISNGEKEDKLEVVQKNNIVELKPDQNLLKINVAPFTYSNVEKIEYAWRLNQTSEYVVQSSNIIQLNSLPYGDNQLEVKARYHGSKWSENILNYTIHRSRPFYLKWWFFLFLGVVISSMIWSYFEARNRRLYKAKKELELEVEKRTAQINQQAEELKALDKIKSRFFANVTHELRTPLTLIMAPLRDILAKEEVNETVFGKLRRIQKNVKKLLGLVEEILDLSKMEANKLQLDEKEIPLRKTVRRIVFSFASLAEYRNVGLDLEYLPKQEMNLLIDENKFEKILNNLISNALKFTSSDDKVKVVLEDIGENIQIKVIDTGNGIHQEDLPYIFDRYYQSQLPNIATQGGTGIGLSLSNEYAKLLGGELEVESIFKEGSTFTFTIPKIIAHSNELNPSELIPEKSKQSKIIKGKNDKDYTVLVVEDNRDMVDYIYTILSDDYNVFSADNGLTALKQLEKHKFDIIISDVMMPEMDGFQLLENIKNQPELQHLPIVLLTARAETSDKIHALRLGVDDYITKPFFSEELTARIENLLLHYESRKNNKISQESFNSVDDSLIDIDFEKKPSIDAIWLDELEDMVKSNIEDTSFNVSQLAFKMHISERNLRTKIKKNTGLTPNHYIREARLTKARQLLENKSYSSIAEICYKVGFKHPANFTSRFKKRFGKLPSDYFNT